VDVHKGGESEAHVNRGGELKKTSNSAVGRLTFSRRWLRRSRRLQSPPCLTALRRWRAVGVFTSKQTSRRLRTLSSPEADICVEDLIHTADKNKEEEEEADLLKEV